MAQVVPMEMNLHLTGDFHAPPPPTRPPAALDARLFHCERKPQ